MPRSWLLGVVDKSLDMDAGAKMVDPDEVVLNAATMQDAELLSNLLELYIHDMSEVFPNVELGADGRFGYEKLPVYWSDPDRRFPFLIKRAAGVVGFILVTRASPVTDDPDVFDIVEFFVLRGHRRSGIGRQAAFLLWDRLPGTWIVRVSKENVNALSFWSGIISEYTNGTAIELRRSGIENAWRVFTFNSGSRTSIG
jgi:predicted acetyltransferase